MYHIKKTLLCLPLIFSLSLTGCGGVKEKISGAKPVEVDTNSNVDANIEDNDQNTIEDSNDQIDTSHFPTYTVAMNTNYPPFEYIGEDGKLIGFDIDLLNAIAAVEQFNVTYQPYTFEQIIPAVQDGTADMSASAVFISEDIKKLVDFSTSYFTMPMYVVGLEQANRPQSLDEITGKKIAIEDHSFLDKITQETFVPMGNEIIKTKTHFLAYQMLHTKKADVMIENIMSIKDHNQYDNGSDPLFYIPLPKESSIYLGYITKKGNTELMGKLNAGLKTIKADGTYDKIYNTWFSDIKEGIN